MPHLIRVLEDDHQKIRSVCEGLKSACAVPVENRDDSFCWENFEILKKILRSHSEAEEAALYDLFEDDAVPHQSNLRDLSLEGYEEHSLMNLMLEHMDRHRQIDDVWKAQLTVLSELLDHHLDEEEKDFFPKVKSALDDGQLRDIAVIYITERDDLLNSYEDEERPSKGIRDGVSSAHP
ncbi:MAG TPA: hemerythrin domain-containing protein [Pseudobdellovibrionaceae bacterium]|nr:hemerythrin domain-containing protein [Pseudobdellovibrionaceae bacterium]